MTNFKEAYQGWGGDPTPANEPQAQNDVDTSVGFQLYDRPEIEPGTGDYNFFLGNNQLEVSAEHSHDELSEHAGVQADKPGPTALGKIEVDKGRAHWLVSGNYALNGLVKRLKDYTKQVGWRWGGIASLDGNTLGDQFMPKKALFYAEQDGLTVITARPVEDSQPIILQGRTAHVNNPPEGIVEWAKDSGYKLAEYPGGGDMNDMLKRNQENGGEDLEQFDMGANNVMQDPNDEPEVQNGLYHYHGKEFATYEDYLRYKVGLTKDIDSPVDGSGGFPKNPDMDKPLPGNFHDRQQYFEAHIITANAHEASRVKGYQTYSDVWHFSSTSNRHYVAYANGKAIGYAVVASDGNLLMASVDEDYRGTGVSDRLIRHARRDHPEMYTSAASEEGKRAALRVGFVEVREGFYRLSEKMPKDILEAPVPFIFDIDADTIVIGHPGSHTADIPGKFTPGGIVEGEYAPGGKVTVSTATNMPWTTRHLIDLWYWQHPQMEVTGVELMDNDGKKRKLASEGLPEVRYYSELEKEPHSEHPAFDPAYTNHAWVQDKSDTIHLSPPGWYHADFMNRIGLDWANAVRSDRTNGFMQRYLDRPEEQRVQAALENHLGQARSKTPDDWHFGRRSARLSSVDVGSYLKTLAMADPAVDRAYKALRDAGGEVYVVGGAVRDALLQKQPKDIDLMVRGLSGDVVNHVLSQIEGKVDLTGKAFGVYRYRVAGHEVEIALPRTEVSTGDKRTDFDFNVDKDIPVEQDLQRRDFTVNAMAVNLDDGKLIDPFDGAKDIENKQLRTVSTNSFREDPTRLLRGLVAASRHGLQPTEEMRSQMAENAHRLGLESPDRVGAEFDKIMRSPNPAGAIRLAKESGLLQHLVPELHNNFDFDQNNPHHKHTLGQHTLNVLEGVQENSDDLDLRTAALFHDLGKPASHWRDPETGTSHYYRGPNGQGDNHDDVGAKIAETRLNSLRWPKRRSERIQHLIQHHMFPAFSSDRGARKFLNRVGDEHADDLLTLRHADQFGKGTNDYQKTKTPVGDMRGYVQRVREAGSATGQADLAINGKDIMDHLGIRPGPEVGQHLQRATDKVLEDPTYNNRNDLLNFLSDGPT